MKYSLQETQLRHSYHRFATYAILAFLVLLSGVIFFVSTQIQNPQSTRIIRTQAAGGSSQNLENWYNSLNFPRIFSRHVIVKDTVDYDPVKMSKYDLVGSFNVTSKEEDAAKREILQKLLQENPSLKTTIYETSRTAQTQDDLLRTYPGHFLFFAGSRLAKKLDVGDDIAVVEEGNKFHEGFAAMLWDFDKNAENPALTAEHVLIKKVEGNKLTLQRGYKGRAEGEPAFSPVKAHPKDTVIAMHVSDFPKEGEDESPMDRWLVNEARLCEMGITQSCDKDNQSYPVSYAKFLSNRVKDSGTNGVKIDSADAVVTVWGREGREYTPDIDINNDLLPDGGTPNGKNLWAEGLHTLFQRVRQNTNDQTIVIANGAEQDNSINGALTQGTIARLTNDPNEILSFYFTHMKNDFKPRIFWIDSEVYPSDIKNVRFALAATLMDNGMFHNKGGPGGQPNGVDAWYDEYDNGAGSSLVHPVTVDSDSLDIYPGTGTRFQAGDIVYSAEEIFYVNAVIINVNNNNSADRLKVRRAYVPDYFKSIFEKIPENRRAGFKAVPHEAREKIYTIAQVRQGKGYLGKAINEPTRDCSTGSPLKCFREYNNGIVFLNPTNNQLTFPLNRTYYRIKGTQDPTVNNGQMVTGSVNLEPKSGLILVKRPADIGDDTQGIEKDLKLKVSAIKKQGKYSITAKWNKDLATEPGVKTMKVIVRKLPEQTIVGNLMENIGIKTGVTFNNVQLTTGQYVFILRVSYTSGTTYLQKATFVVN